MNSSCQNPLLNPWWCTSGSGLSNNCPDSFGCNSSTCPNFIINRHDTKPNFVVPIVDCVGPIDLTGLVCEASMWAIGLIKTAITTTDTYFALADNVGFNQCLVGDIILVDRVRLPELMLITGFDESLNLIRVQRGYSGSTVSSYKKGQAIKIFRILNSFASTQMIEQNITDLNGNCVPTLTESDLVYNWMPNDTCVPGCFYFEFKLLKMLISPITPMFLSMCDVSQTPSFISFTPSQAGCELGVGVEWVRRYGPFTIQINNTPTSENLAPLQII